MKCSVFTSKASSVFCEDVKKRLRLLSEERLSPREVKTCVFVIKGRMVYSGLFRLSEVNSAFL